MPSEQACLGMDAREEAGKGGRQETQGPPRRGWWSSVSSAREGEAARQVAASAQQSRRSLQKTRPLSDGSNLVSAFPPQSSPCRPKNSEL